MKPIISIIIPTYNREKQLEKTINSVLNQTYLNFELLICDDGSTDGTELMVKECQDTRIKWIPGKNTGWPSVPRNRGIREAQGEWIAFLDSDDLWHPQKLEKQLEILQEESSLASCTNADVLKNNTISSELYFHNIENRCYSFDDMLIVNLVICSSMIVHKSILDTIGCFPEEEEFKAIEDYALWLPVSMLTKICYLNEPLTIYRDDSSDSLRKEATEPEYLKYIRVIKEAFKRTGKLSNTSRYRKKLLFTYISVNIKHYKEKIIQKLNKCIEK